MAILDEHLATLDPGPVDGSVLTLQSRHRSQAIGEGKTVSRIRLIEHGKAFSQWIVTHGCALTLLRDAGMYHVSRLCRVILDHALLRALIERWRPETQTFHFRVGEMTITLRDVALLAALRVDGEPVTCTTLREYKDLCIQLLGQTPDHIQAGCVKLKWLRSTFMHDIATDAPQEVVEHYTRAYILYLFGSILFPDPSGNKVNLKWLLFLGDLKKCGQFAWGAAALAHIYRELGKVSLMGHTDCCCFLALVQMWAWEYLPFIRPSISTHQEHQHDDGAQPISTEMGNIVLGGVLEDSPVGCRWLCMSDLVYKLKTSNVEVYRNKLDLMNPSQVLWNPYSLVTIKCLPEICREHREVWMSRTPLICIETVQMHVPDRVMRQFGLLQHIPETVESIAAVTRQGKVAEDWEARHSSYITQWRQRRRYIVAERADLGCASDRALEAYMSWYWRITRRWIITPSHRLAVAACLERAPLDSSALMDAIRYIHGVAIGVVGSDLTLETARYALDQIAARCSDILLGFSSSLPPGLVVQSPPGLAREDVATCKYGRRRCDPTRDEAETLVAQENAAEAHLPGGSHTPVTPFTYERPTARRRCCGPVIDEAEHLASFSTKLEADDPLLRTNQINLLSDKMDLDTGQIGKDPKQMDGVVNGMQATSQIGAEVDKVDEECKQMHEDANDDQATDQMGAGIDQLDEDNKLVVGDLNDLQTLKDQTTNQVDVVAD